jgi:hypothetical protein
MAEALEKWDEGLIKTRYTNLSDSQTNQQSLLSERMFGSNHASCDASLFSQAIKFGWQVFAWLVLIPSMVFQNFIAISSRKAFS